MNTLKKILVGVCASLLTLTLFGFGLTWSIHKVIGGPADIKHALTSSGIYQSGIGDALAQAQNGQQGGGNDQVPLNNADVRSVIKDAFPPAYVQSQAEGALDNVFSWLDGKTTNLTFAIDLSNPKQRLADGLDAYVQKRLGGLPACTGAAAVNANFDPYNATCVPRGISIADAGHKARDEILRGDFLKDAKLDASTIKTDDGKTLEQQLQPAKNAYSCVKWCVVATGIASVVLSAAVILLSTTWRSGVHKVAVVCISIGALNAIVGWVGNIIAHRGVDAVIKSSSANQPLQQKGVHIGESLVHAFLQSWMVYGIVLLALGTAALLALHYTKPKMTAETLAGEPEPAPGSTKPPHKGLKPNLPDIKG